MTTTPPEEQGKTAPIELPATAGSPPPPATAPLDGAGAPLPAQLVESPPAEQPVAEPLAAAVEPPLVARAASPMQQEVMYVPLAVSIGDGFKFGCGFFLAATLMMLVAFVLVAALFVLTGLFGLSLPIGR